MRAAIGEVAISRCGETGVLASRGCGILAIHSRKFVDDSSSALTRGRQSDKRIGCLFSQNYRLFHNWRITEGKWVRELKRTGALIRILRVDRGGDYKDYIDELKGDLPWAMEITRNLLTGK